MGNVFGVGNQDILLEIPSALQEEKSVPSVNKKGHFAVMCKTNSKEYVSNLE